MILLVHSKLLISLLTKLKTFGKFYNTIKSTQKNNTFKEHQLTNIGCLTQLPMRHIENFQSTLNDN